MICSGFAVVILYQSGNCPLIYVKDGTGAAIAETANHIANLNPIRYRSYYYDTETGFYYLNTRYYDPSIGRFINADGFVTTGQGFFSYNMYAYCLNNPVNLCDDYGVFPLSLSIEMYLKSVFTLRNKEYNFKDTEIGRMLKMRLMESEALGKIVDEYSKKASSGRRKYKVYRGTIPFYNSNNSDDVDLSYSVGDANAKVTVTQTQDATGNSTKYRVSVDISDTYDFEYWDSTKRNGITLFINNTFGYQPMEKGFLKPYKWTFRCTFDVWRKN